MLIIISGRSARRGVHIIRAAARKGGSPYEKNATARGRFGPDRPRGPRGGSETLANASG